MNDNLKLSDYFTIICIVPETHADLIRKLAGEIGAGEFGNYSFCSFSSKGTGRFMPNKSSNAHLGNLNNLESVTEERIEFVCDRKNLEKLIEELKKAHPYENTVIDIIPIYKIGLKK